MKWTESDLGPEGATPRSSPLPSAMPRGASKTARQEPAGAAGVRGSRSGSGTPAGVSPPASFTAGSVFDHADYQVIRELGRGGMGVVYLAEHRLTGRKEVLKIVDSQLLSRKGVKERFLREIRAAVQLNHPNIVTAFSASQSGESLVFSMQYIEGHDLAHIVEKQGPLPVAHACNFIYQAALGLQHAHERGMVHRDIKPANLMLTRDGNKPLIKILDFGLARVTSEAGVDGGLTQAGQMLGTPHYIAPEQTVDAQNADIRADIYSLGCTLYCLLSGHPPFDAPSLYGLLQAHHSMDAEPLHFLRPGDVPVELTAVVDTMMAKEPERRYQTPGEVAEALKPFFKGKSAPGVPPASSRMRESGTLLEGPPNFTPGGRTLVEVPTDLAAAGRTILEAPPHRADRTFLETPAALGGRTMIEPGFAGVPANHGAGTTTGARSRPGWLWPAVGAGIGLVGVLLGTFLNRRPEVSPSPTRPAASSVGDRAPRVAQAIEVPKPPAAPAPPPTQRRREAKATQTDSLPEPPPATTSIAGESPTAGSPEPDVTEATAPSAGPSRAAVPATLPGINRMPGTPQGYALATNRSPSVPRRTPATIAGPDSPGTLVDAADPRKRAYVEYAAFVRELEHKTDKIPFNKIGLRTRNYWAPLNDFATQLASRYRLSQQKLIDLVRHGYEESWPTERTEDREMLARSFHRMKTEFKVAARRAESRVGMQLLDGMAAMAIQQATAAGTIQNNANAAAGRRALGGR